MLGDLNIHIVFKSLLTKLSNILPLQRVLTRILGLGKKPCYMKFVLVGLYCGSLITLLNHRLHVHKPKTVVVETLLVIFV